MTEVGNLSRLRVPVHYIHPVYEYFKNLRIFNIIFGKDIDCGYFAHAAYLK